MDPITAGIVTGGMGLAGGLFQNEQNSREAGNNRAWQQHMASTAHQRSVNDLRAAGLNPVLSALGNGAATPSGAQAQMGNLSDGLSKGMDTAIAIRAQNKALDLQDAEIDLKHDQASNLAVQRSMSIPETQIKNSQASQEELKTKMLKQTLPAMVKKAKAEGNWAEVNQLMGVINAGTSSAKDIVDTVNPIKNVLTTIPSVKGKK